jgi:hypothetical protein
VVEIIFAKVHVLWGTTQGLQAKQQINLARGGACKLVAALSTSTWLDESKEWIPSDSSITAKLEQLISSKFNLNAVGRAGINYF